MEKTPAAERAQGWLPMAAAAVGAAIVAALAFTPWSGPAPEPAATPGVLPLAGVWRLAEGDGAARSAPGVDDSEWQAVTLPATAAELGIDEPHGTLWLRREILLPRGWQSRLAPAGLAVLLGGSDHGRFELYAGGARVASSDGPQPGLAPAPPRVYELEPAAVDRRGRLRLALRFWRDAGGLPQDELGRGWLLGDRARLRAVAELEARRARERDLAIVILAALFFAVGLYHLQLFRRDRTCGEYLGFGLTAVLAAFYTFLYTTWSYLLTDDYALLYRLGQLAGPLIAALSIQFLWPFLSRPIDRWLRLYQLSFLAHAAFVLAAPAGWLIRTELLRLLWGVPFLIAFSALLAREWRRGSEEARTIGPGAAVFLIAAVAVIGSQLLGHGNRFPLPPLAFAVFTLAMAFSLSGRFSRVHNDLDALRQRLEDMVEDRRAELSEANRRLESEIAERQLAKGAMRKLERAVEQSIDGILVTDLEGGVRFINESWAALHGYEAFEVFGRGLDLFHSAEQMAEEVGPCLDRVREQGAFEGEIRHRRKDGSTFPAWMSATLLRGADGAPEGFVIVARDITDRRHEEAERRRIETRIQETEKLKSLAALAGAVAHDYNNLLTGVMGNASLALRTLPDDSPARDKLARINAVAERAADLTAQLLAYAGSEEAILRRLDLGELVGALRPELDRMTGDDVALSLELGSEPLPVEADRERLRQVLVQLVSNAAQAMPEGGIILVRAGRVEARSASFADAYPPGEEWPPGEYVFLRVTDAGEGIDERIKGRIFDPFFTTRGAARGLGLATVLSAIRAHGGAIRFTSEPGAGTTFEVLLPALAETVDVPAPPLATAASDGTILVVDDQRIMRDVSRSILEQAGFDVLDAGDGEQALELYARHRSAIKLVVLDRTMPAMSGEEVLRRILELDAGARVILMSGYLENEATRELVEQGLAHYLPKPFRPEELLAKVHEVIGA